MAKLLGKYKAFVRDNNDPEKRGRVRCYCPQLMGPTDSPQFWLDWAEPCFTWMGGLHTGEFGPPFTRDEQVEHFGSEYLGVWVEFQDGDLDFPIWVGVWPVAATADAASAIAQGTVAGAKPVVGGGVMGHPDLPTGTSLEAINPPRPQKERELRLVAPKNVDIVILTDGGGSIVVGRSGVSINGIQLLLNGAPFLASSTALG